MARKRPPQHRADAPGVFIPRSDSSFDQDRYDRELAQLEAEGGSRKDHPIERYYSGSTRYDLAAQELLFGQVTTAGSYFRPEENPEKWILRRLDWDQWHRVMGLIEQGAFGQAQLLAARFGIKGVENSPIKLEGAEAGLLTHQDMQRIHDADATLATALGFAAWKFSRPLDDVEKKV